MLAMVVSSFGTSSIVPTTVQAQEPIVGAGFELDAGDLRFIYQQILIAQRHAATPGSSPFGPGPNQVPEVRLPFGLRTVDGSFNHLETVNTTFGQADQLFPRRTAPVFPEAEDHTADLDGPGPQQVGDPSSYKQLTGSVNDSQPRMISNLIVDQTLANPAAVAAYQRATGDPEQPVPDESGTIFIPNLAPDVGLSAPFNTMMVFFGQFFDHGLDLVAKDPAQIVFMPLREDDPLFDQVPPNMRFMVINRSVVAAVNPGPDGIPGTDDDYREARNKTTPFVDQNQTYTSHPSHQVFLRDYDMVGGRPVPNGKVADGVGGNIATWGDLKQEALAKLGIRLEDMDVLNVPLIATDPYGHFIPGPARGMAQLVTAAGLVEGNSNGSVSPAGVNALRTGHQFLDDIAHAAVPNAQGNYDAELLADHHCTGDGRGNENIALTAVHTIFHSEHNRLAIEIGGAGGATGSGGLIDTLLTPAEAQAWRDVDPASGWGYGERVFQAARFVTEMQYQHLVFEEFARKVSPSVNEFIGDGVNFQTELNPAIVAEFAHTVYRFGHSMLTETISRTMADGSTVDIPLLDAFLNPRAFTNVNGQVLDARQAAGAIFQGGTRQVANEIDEFKTEALRNRLLGLPLDLAAINLARGRSEGIPPLNEVRRQLYEASGDSIVAPYLNWADFQLSMRNPESLANYIAAYSTHPAITAATTIGEKRAIAIMMVELGDAHLVQPAAESGLNNVDLWIGGLAEKQSPFGGLLGSTFNDVFERQLESLQNGDRFYYLERLDGLNLLAQLEGNSFSELIARNTNAGSAFALDVFARPDFIFNLAAQNLSGPIVDDPATEQDETVELIRLADNSIRYAGPAHVIFNGRNDANGDFVVSSEGDDTFRGNAGNDRFEGGAGNDTPVGSDGDDILTDTFGEDVIKGGRGNDAINGGFGPFDLLQGNEGNDFVVGGNDVSEVFGGSGNDVIYVGKGATEAFGGAGDDWMEGSDSPASVLVGDENNQFQDDPNGGHDVFLAGPGDADFDMEGGDDIMVANVTPTHRLEGMLGFDWATYSGETKPVDADMLITGATAINAPLNELRDRYDLTESLSGTNFNDLLRGDDRIEAELRDDGLTGVANGHVLTSAGIARISGLAALLPAGATEFAGGNIILGGAGNDIIEGRGGNDILDGDAWLNVQLQATLNGGTVRTVSTLKDLRLDVFANPQRLNPGNITILRTIMMAAGPDSDTAVFSGNRAEYTIQVNTDGSLTVAHTAPAGNIDDGTDRLRNFELLQFADQTIPATGGVVGGTLVPNVGGLTEAAARAALIDAGLVPGVATFSNNNGVANGIVLSTDPLAGIGVAAGSTVNLSVSRGPLIPDIHDHTVVNNDPPGFPAAQDELALSGLVLGTITLVDDPEVEAGLIVTQNPLPTDQGGVVAPGGAVNVFVSRGPAAANTVPQVAGLPQADAEGSIESVGLAVGAITFETSAVRAAGSVIRTNPVAGTVLAPGAAVAIVVSLGTDGLVLALGFDEASGTAAVDSSVVGRNGTARQATMQRQPGKFGRAMRFDGVDDWVTVADVVNSPLDLRNSMTIEAWVNPTSVSGWETVVMKERAGGLAYALYAHDGAPQADGVAAPAGYNRIGIEDQSVKGTTQIPLNQWTHLAMTYNGTHQRLYVNGVMVRERAQTGLNIQNNNQLRIGGNNQWATEFFNGMIDEVKIFNTVRSQTQIQSDMNTPINPLP